MIELSNKSNIDFVLISDVQGMHFHYERPEGIEFKPKSEQELHIILKPNKSDVDASGHRQGLICKTYATYPATEEQVHFVDSYNNKKLIVQNSDGITLPYAWNDKILIAEDGKFSDGFHPRRYQCPKDIIQLIEVVESDLLLQTDRFLKLMRWRQNFDSPEKVVTHSTLYWRVREGAYPITPLDEGPHKQTEVEAMFGIHWDESYSAEIEDLWKINTITEPLGHSLLREAATLSYSSPLSSILIMTTALETAVKMHISQIAPETQWLMQELQSPPIFKILKDYIPGIYRLQGKEIEFWDNILPLIKKTQKLFEIRNKVAHTGKLPPDSRPIDEYLNLVSDILYLIDVLEGHEWAKSFVSHEYRKTLNWPSPKEPRITIQISQPY